MGLLHQRKRRAHNFHLAGAVQLLICRKVGDLCRLLKEALHFASRLEANKDLSWRRAHVGPDVWHLSRCKKGIAGSQSHPLLSDLEDVFALHHIEPFLLSMMEMAWWTAFPQAHLLEDKQSAVGILTGDFVGNLVRAGDRALLAEAIHAVFHPNNPSGSLAGRSL